MFDQWEPLLYGMMDILSNGMCLPQFFITIRFDLNIYIILRPETSCLQKVYAFYTLNIHNAVMHFIHGFLIAGFIRHLADGV